MHSNVLYICIVLKLCTNIAKVLFSQTEVHIIEELNNYTISPWYTYSSLLKTLPLNFVCNRHLNMQYM